MSRVLVRSRRGSRDKILRELPGAAIIDVTSKGPDPWVRFSPFYPHGTIPVPFTPDRTAQSVEGVWQALKVFETADVDATKLDITAMKGLKRTVRRFGRCLGHREGLEGTRLLSYLDARRRIYLPTYTWVLENCLAEELKQLNALRKEQDLVLLDYETNTDIENLAKPLSHAGVIANALVT
ncbi:MAG: hypothetical protein AAGE52_24915 [Myxococcota bacterium]